MSLRPSSIKICLLILVLIVILPCTFLIVYVTYNYSLTLAEKEKEKTLNIAQQISGEINEFIKETKGVLMTLSHLPEIDPEHASSCSRLFSKLLKHYPRYLNIGVAAMDGNIFCSAIPLKGKVNISDREYFRHAIKRGDLGIGVYQIGRITGLPSVNVGYPVFDENNNIKAVIFAALNLMWINELPSRIGLPQGSIIMAVDQNGVIITGNPDGKIWTGRSVIQNPLIKRVLNERKGASSGEEFDGVKRLYGFSFTGSDYEAGKLHIIVGIPEEVVLSKTRKILITGFSTLAIIAFLSALLAYAAGNRLIARKINSLIHVTEAVKGGNLSLRPGIKSGIDEIDRLASSFDEMIRSLENKTKELVEAESRYRQLIEKIPAITYLCHPDKFKRIYYISPQAETITGFSPDEIIGDPGLLLNQIHEQDRDKVISQLKNISQEKGIFSIIYRMYRRDGSLCWIEERGGYITDENGKPLFLQGIMIDITEKKVMEERYFKFQRMETIGELSAGIIHDLKNMLTPINLSVSILKGKYTDDEGKKLLDIIDDCIKKGASLINNLLLFIRGGPAEKSLIDVRAMLMNIESIVRGTFPKTIRISFNIPENLWPIYGNRTQIEQVVMNILKNASDAMPHGGDLSLIVENEFIEKKYLERAIDAKEGPYVCITVSDSGEGMSDDVRKRLFEPFFTTKESSKGTGLGLFTSQSIVKAHDGFIRVYSEHGKGSTFKIYLPAITTPEDLEVFKYEADRVSGNGELILVIDDELTICDLIKLVLEDHGYRVIVAVSVEEGERILKEKASEISAILMDLGLFGYESTTIERFVSIDKTVKIIATSGSLINLDGIKKAGINIREFLLKPLAIDKLLLALRRTIDLPS